MPQAAEGSLTVFELLKAHFQDDGVASMSLRGSVTESVSLTCVSFPLSHISPLNVGGQ